MTNPATPLVDRLARELADEEAKIAAAIAAKAIGDGSGYWKRAHALRRRLAVAIALGEALEGEG